MKTFVLSLSLLTLLLLPSSLLMLLLLLVMLFLLLSVAVANAVGFDDTSVVVAADVIVGVVANATGAAAVAVVPS